MCGLKVKILGCVNDVLLGKLIWGLKIVKIGLWREVLDSKYGVWKDLKSNSKSNKKSIWWSDLKRVWSLEEWGNKFEDKIF